MVTCRQSVLGINQIPVAENVCELSVYSYVISNDNQVCNCIILNSLIILVADKRMNKTDVIVHL